jgi:hypothetical protein
MKTEKEIREKMNSIEEINKKGFEESAEHHNVFNVLSWILSDKDDKILLLTKENKFILI